MIEKITLEALEEFGYLITEGKNRVILHRETEFGSVYIIYLKSKDDYKIAHGIFDKDGNNVECFSSKFSDKGDVERSLVRKISIFYTLLKKEDGIGNYLKRKE